MYVMSCTRSDIAFPIGILIRFTSNLRKPHWDNVQRLIRYLKETTDLVLLYTGYPAMIEGFSDASLCSESDECRSTEDFVSSMGGAAILWKSKKKTLIAQSSMESKSLHYLL